jgi:hypothetical protein
VILLILTSQVVRVIGCESPVPGLLVFLNKDDRVRLIGIPLRFSALGLQAGCTSYISLYGTLLFKTGSHYMAQAAF